MRWIRRLTALLSRIFRDPSSIISVIAVLISLAGILYQHNEVTITESQRELEVHALLIERNSNILEIFVEKPNLRKYFYDNIPVGNDNTEQTQVMTMAELWTDFFEQVTIQLPYLSPSMVPTWRCYAIDMYKSSPAIRKHFTERRAWYALQLRNLWDKNTSCSA